jgi:hypothetical protein
MQLKWINNFTPPTEPYESKEKSASVLEKKKPKDQYENPYKKLDFPVVTDVGPLGVKWRGEDVPRSNSMFPDDYRAIFGFTCAECGGSGVNSDPVNHKEKCERKENESL